MMRGIGYALVPLLVLLVASLVASVLGFALVQVFEGLPLQKTINKITQGLLVLGIFPAMYWLKLDKTDLGFAPRWPFLQQLAQGFGLGFVTLMPVFIVLTIVGINVPDGSHAWTFGWILQKSSVAMLLSLLISLIEEPLFRGILLAGLLKKLPVPTAIAVSAVYYACLHFIKTPRNIPAAEASFFDTLGLLADAFANLLNPEIISPFLSLLMVGLFLGMLRLQGPANLGLCIGCHTCWVSLIKMDKTLFNTNFNLDLAFLVSHYDGVIGPLVTVWLALAIAGYWLWAREKGGLKSLS